nr:uncharacterized protein LOC129381367 isoform X1 [Dermacentor andersoni]
MPATVAAANNASCLSIMGSSNLLVVFVHATSVLVAPPRAAGSLCTPNFCSNVTCKPIEASECNGKVEPNASDCGCCEQCIVPLDEGDLCLSFVKFGSRKWPDCKQGLKCNETTMRCDKNSTRLISGNYNEHAATTDVFTMFL